MVQYALKLHEAFCRSVTHPASRQRYCVAPFCTKSPDSSNRLHRMTVLERSFRLGLIAVFASHEQTPQPRTKLVKPSAHLLEHPLVKSSN